MRARARPALGALALLVALPGAAAAQAPAPVPAPQQTAQQEVTPMRSTLEFQGAEREYFAWLPAALDPARTYWLVVAVHGGGNSNGRAFFQGPQLRRAADALGLDAIVVTPSFSNSDETASRFPVLGEGAFLERVIEAVRAQYRVQPKILLTGYSRGGQFVHRFAFEKPELVQAAAPLAAGTWTTPDGRLLIDALGEIEDPEAFLRAPENQARIRETRADLLDPRVAPIAGRRPQPGAQRVPFLVMCGTLDPRLEGSREFARRLEKAGFRAQTWDPLESTCRHASLSIL